MSTSDTLTILKFKTDFLNEACSLKNSLVQWINSDEFLLIFDTFCLACKQTPFHVAGGCLDKFPIDMIRIQIENRTWPVVLNYSLNLLKYADVDTNFARAACDVSRWREINETVADPLFLQPTFAGGPTSSETDAGLEISQVFVENLEKESDRIVGVEPMMILQMTDGRAEAALKLCQDKYDFVSLTSILYDYINGNVELLRQLLPDLETYPPTNEEPTTLIGLQRILRLGRFLSTNYWFPTNMKYPGAPKENCGISLQRTGHVIGWRYTVEPGWRTFQVISVSDILTDMTVSNAILLAIDEKKCAILIGTVTGEILNCPVSVSLNGMELEKKNLQRLLANDNCKIRINMMRLFPLSENGHLLLISQHFFLTALILTSSTTGNVKVTSKFTQRISSRFSAIDVVKLEDAFYIVTADKVLKYEIRITEDVKMRLLSEDVVPNENKRILGLTFSANGALRYDVSMRKFVDGGATHAKPLSVQIQTLLEPRQVWTNLMDRTDLKTAMDYLMVFRSFIIHPEHSKLISNLLREELKSVETKFVNVTRLKVFRLAVIIFAGKRNKAVDMEFWNNAKWTVERLLMIKAAKANVERARTMANLGQSNILVQQMVASSVAIIRKELPEESVDLDGLVGPHCPLCNAQTFQSSSISEHICTNNHRMPACALSLLPIPSFSYRKCRRCGLSVLDQDTIANLAPLIEEMDCCQFCDGKIITP